MEIQTKLFNNLENEGNLDVSLTKKEDSLEQEKDNFIKNMCGFIEPLNFEQLQIIGRPKADFKDIIKSLCVMSYHGMSYRRTQSDLRWMYERGLIKNVPPRSTLNDYANEENTKKILENLIQISALFFQENEDTLILDSTWFGQRMYTGGYRKVHDKTSGTLNRVRKLHIGCLKNSKIIAVAKASEGTKHDSPMFSELVKKPKSNGFHLNTIIADAGYSSKNNYAICKELGIFNVFIDFRSNATLRRSKSDIWREKLRLYREQKEIWNETYRFRVIVEGIFSTIKKKNLNYLRSKKETSRDVEILLKVLVYNLTIIGRYS